MTDQSVSDRGSPMDDDKRLCHDRAISLHFSIGISRRLRQFSTRLGMRVLSDSRFQISNPFFSILSNTTKLYKYIFSIGSCGRRSV